MSIQKENALAGLPTEGRARLAALIPFIGISVTEVNRRIAAGRFPKPAKLSPRCSLFDLSQVADWVKDPVNYRAPGVATNDPAGGAK